MKGLVDTLHFIYNHPLTRHHKLSSTWRFFRWQVMARTFHLPVVYPFVEGSKMVVQRGMTGATGNIYTGLHEFEDMMFLLHLLRPDDYFADVGANIGSYTILASAVVHAKTICFEPIPSTFSHLRHNVSINDIEQLVELHNCGIGAQPGKLNFTGNFDTVNHVVLSSEQNGNGNIEVDIKTLDDVLMIRIPALIKIDVEGFEMAVLQGASQTLSDHGLKGLIIELNGSCHRYGTKEEDIHRLLISVGFIPVSYSPFERKYNKLDSFKTNGNTIYIRDEDFIKKRLKEARKFQVREYAI